MSRQRLRPALSEGASIPCPRCGGSGHIRDTESSALQILRIIQEESLKDNTASVLCQVPVEVASFLLNEKRTEIAKIELKQRINVLMVPNKTLETPNYKLERLKHDDPRLDNIEASYKMAEEMEDPTSVTRRSQEPTNKQTPIIKGVLPDAPAPAAIPKPEAVKPAAAPHKATPIQAAPVKAEQGFFGWIKNLFAPAPVPTPAAPVKPVAEANKEVTREGRGGRDGARRNEPRGDRPEGREEGRNGRGPRPEGREDGRGARGGRGGRGGRGDRPAQGQRERFDAEGKPVMADAAQASLNGTSQDAPRNDMSQGQERPPRNAERGGRGERNSRGDRSRNERTDNVELGNTAERSEPRADGRNERRPDRNRRPDDSARTEAPAEGMNRANAEVQPAAAQNERAAPQMNEAAASNEQGPSNGEPVERTEGNEGRGKRSRDRYGRERGPRGERNEQPAERQEQTARDSQPTQTQDAPAEEPRRSYFAPQGDATAVAPAAAPAPVLAAEVAPVVAAPVVTAPVVTQPVAAALVEAKPVPAPAPVAAPVAAAQAPAPAGMPKLQPFALPLAELAQVAESSGLNWVNSNAEKIAAVQAAIAAEPKPVRVPRERPPAVKIESAPLVMIETKRDLKDMKLPFETPQ
jgi:ribonuclease E